MRQCGNAVDAPHRNGKPSHVHCTAVCSPRGCIRYATSPSFQGCNRQGKELAERRIRLSNRFWPYVAPAGSQWPIRRSLPGSRTPVLVAGTLLASHSRLPAGSPLPCFVLRRAGRRRPALETAAEPCGQRPKLPWIKRAAQRKRLRQSPPPQGYLTHRAR